MASQKMSDCVETSSNLADQNMSIAKLFKHKCDKHKWYLERVNIVPSVEWKITSACFGTRFYCRDQKALVLFLTNQEPCNHGCIHFLGLITKQNCIDSISQSNVDIQPSFLTNVSIYPLLISELMSVQNSNSNESFYLFLENTALIHFDLASAQNCSIFATSTEFPYLTLVGTEKQLLIFLNFIIEIFPTGDEDDFEIHNIEQLILESDRNIWNCRFGNLVCLIHTQTEEENALFSFSGLLRKYNNESFVTVINSNVTPFYSMDECKDDFQNHKLTIVPLQDILLDTVYGNALIANLFVFFQKLITKGWKVKNYIDFTIFYDSFDLTLNIRSCFSGKFIIDAISNLYSNQFLHIPSDLHKIITEYVINEPIISCCSQCDSIHTLDVAFRLPCCLRYLCITCAFEILSRHTYKYTHKSTSHLFTHPPSQNIHDITCEPCNDKKNYDSYDTYEKSQRYAYYDHDDEY